LGEYIKVNQLSQNHNATKFALPFNDNGVFKFRSFGRDTRTQEVIEAEEVNFNTLLKLDDWTMCLNGSPDPFITCCFVTDEIVFINLFHTFTKKHYHFFFNIDKREIEGDFVELDIENYSSNFPLKCIYNEDKQEVYSFWRLGESFIVPLGDAKGYQMDVMENVVLGTMYLVYNKALVAGTSDCTSFYKL
jgi:hypothetical protein